MKYSLLLLIFIWSCSRISVPSDKDLSDFKGDVYVSTLKEMISDTSIYVKSNSKIYLNDSLAFIFVDTLTPQKLFVKEILKNDNNTVVYWLSYNEKKTTTDANIYVESKTDSIYIQYVVENEIKIFHNCYKK